MNRSSTTSQPAKLSDHGIELPPDDADFYWRFIMQRQLKGAEILATENIEEPLLKTFTLYTIVVRTEFLEFSIQKRYSEFLALVQKIEKKYREISPYLKDFPAKRMFGNLDPEHIETRKNLLNDFLRVMTTKYEEHMCFDFLEFLEIKDRMEKNKVNILELKSDSKITSKISTCDEKELAKILEKINNNTQNLAGCFGEIEGYFAKNSPALSTDFIKLLLFGENKIKGLVHFCGKKGDNAHIVCSSGLRLFNKLLDFEFNKDAENFVRVFSNGSPSLVAQLQFSYHFPEQSQKPCSIFAFRIFDYYYKRNPGLKKELFLTIVIPKI